jgi:ketosteroid isomerase-like protein
MRKNRRRVWVGIVISMLWLSVLPCQAAEKNDAVAAEVEQAIKNYVEAFGQKSIEGAMAFYDEDAVLMGTGDGEIYEGKEAIKNAHIQFFSSFDKEEIETLWRKLTVKGDRAYVMSANKVKSQYKDQPVEFYLNISRVLEKKNGKWLCVMDHFSNLAKE